jgi:hypothetical protein
LLRNVDNVFCRVFDAFVICSLSRTIIMSQLPQSRAAGLGSAMGQSWPTRLQARLAAHLAQSRSGRSPSIKALCIALGLVALGVVRAQDVQINASDNAASNLANHTTESETFVARNGSLIVVGYNTFRQFGLLGAGAFTSLSGYAYSNNGGTSFTDAGFLLAGTTSLGSHVVVLEGDPALAFDRSGNLYYASLLEDNTTGNSYIGVSRSTSTSPAVTFGNAAVLSGPSSTISSIGFEDKEFIAVDTTGGLYDGRVYVAWTDFSNQFAFPAPLSIMFAASSTTSPALAFSTPLSLAASSANLLHGAFPLVGPDGSVYVAWSSLTSLSSAAGATINIVKSTDGGAHFANPDSADPNPSKQIASFTSVTPDMATGTALVGKNVVSPLRTRSYPMLAVDNTPVGSPTRGNIYCVFAAQPGTTSSPRSEVFFSASTDGGVTWSAPRNITSDLPATLGADSTNNDNWFPFIAVSPTTGHIRILLYSRREDSTNQKIRVYEAGSTDAGMTFYNSPYSAVSFVASVGYDSSVAGGYMGDYLSAYLDGNGLFGAWGDARNTCNPPTGATAPCSPSGRGDQDVWSHSEVDPTGVDLAVTPWGAVTGVGATWQSPDIFVIDAANAQVNARLGVINNLQARIRNLGNAGATGAIIRFRFAPWYASIPDSAFELIGTATVNVPAGGVPQLVPINWDLTNLNDTNGGIWPHPVSYYGHFCVRVDIEYPSDINLSNNAAQTNFFDVTTSSAPNAPFHFLMGNPMEREATVRLEISKFPLAIRRLIKEPVFGAQINTPRRPTNIAITQSTPRLLEARLTPRQLGEGTITLYRPPESIAAHLKKDLVVDVSAIVNGRPVSGISILLARANQSSREPKSVGVAKVVSREVPVPVPNGDSPVRQFEISTPLALADTKQAIVEYLVGQKIVMEQNDPERGVITSAPIPLDHAQLLNAIAEKTAAALPKDAKGVYFLTFKVSLVKTATGAETGHVLVSTRIIVSQPGTMDSPLSGALVPSNGRLEEAHLSALANRMRR